MTRRSPVAVFVETGSKRVIAGAIDWPGWCRVAKTEELAIDALATYASRYTLVAARAGEVFPAASEFIVAERVRGNATTDFGAPASRLPGDVRPVPVAEIDRLIALMRAAWATLEAVASRTPQSLRPGPRGGGRDRDRMLEHVLGAEHAYARKLGVHTRPPALGDQTAIEAFRDGVMSRCRNVAAADESSPQTSWPVRYFIRRLTWHALDHAWEMEDRSA
ncbi:MAG: hypothetical protein ACREN2_05750 [Candidatus Dormibacteria bacterium]